MKVTVLIENSSDGVLLCEHGLSLLIEYNGKNILLDAGSTDAFYKNAKVLGISLDSVDVCVLSHGHYDHSGGFEAVFCNNKELTVYAQKSAAGQYLSGNGGLHSIGIPDNVLAYRDRFEFVEGYKEIMDGVYLVPHKTDNLDKIGERAKLYKSVEDKLFPDDFSHEQSLVFDTEKGLAIFNSCSHGGVANIINEVKEACGNNNIYAYIGGLHMKGKIDGKEVCMFSDEEIDTLCGVIEREGIGVVYTGHCTGEPGFEKLKKRMGDRVQKLTTGLQFFI